MVFQGGGGELGGFGGFLGWEAVCFCVRSRCRDREDKTSFVS
jgi:hypothetical protein